MTACLHVVYQILLYHNVFMFTVCISHFFTTMNVCLYGVYQICLKHNDCVFTFLHQIYLYHNDRMLTYGI